MTIGTAIVVSIGILCGTFLAACALGVWLTIKKQKAAQKITNEISAKIIENRSKK